MATAHLKSILRSVVAVCLIAEPTLGAGSKPQPECMINGPQLTLENVTIRPKGARPFAVGVRAVRAKATLPKRNGGPVELEVEGPLSFRAQTRNLWLTVVEPYSSPDGLVELRRGARLVHPRVEGDVVVAAAVLYANDILEGEDKEPDETASSVRVPCRSVSFGEEEEQEDSDADPAEQDPEKIGEGSWWKLKAENGKIQLRTRPQVGAPFLLLNSTAVLRLRSEGDWMLVERQGEGVVVRGWVRMSQFKSLPDGVGVGRAYVCYGDHSVEHWKNEIWVPNGPPARLYEGDARVLAGTRVFAEPPAGEWAVFTADTPVVVRHIKGEKWVELRRVPGLDGSPAGSPWLNGHVAVERVVFPAGGLPDGGR